MKRPQKRGGQPARTQTPPDEESASYSRRKFLAATGALAPAAALLDSAATARAADLSQAATPEARARAQRLEQAYLVRHRAALSHKSVPLPAQQTNGDEGLYANKIANFTKGLPHNAAGEVELTSYADLMAAFQSGQPVDFEKVLLGSFRKLANPQAAFSFVLEGPDPQRAALPPPPAFASAGLAAEMGELYWQALTRDVPFSEYETHPLTNEAAADLSRFSAFGGPKTDGRVTTRTLFRGPAPGELHGPYVSQFLLKDMQYGAIPVAQRVLTTPAKLDYMFTYARWLSVQNGDIAGANPYEIVPRYLLDPTPRYIFDGRSLAEYVHRDFSYQAFLSAALILLGLSTSYDRGNPYRKSRTQGGFSTFGEAHVFDIVARVANCALKATWYQKWMVHRFLRPEEFGGRVHLRRSGRAAYPVHAELLDSPALDKVYSQRGTYLLTQSYPEGSPLHPSYPSGHAAIAGACATVLKAFFNEGFVIRDPVVANADGTKLEPYKGPDLHVGPELNKLASNIAFGRNTAGIHWRSDAVQGLRLGEEVALGVMADMKECHNERFAGFSLTKFDGTTVTV